MELYMDGAIHGWSCTWMELYSEHYKNTGQILNRAIAGLDTAVWDLLAKANNQSVCDYAAVRMVPARECRDNVKVYCTNITRQITADQTVDLIANLHTQLEVVPLLLSVVPTAPTVLVTELD